MGRTDLREAMVPHLEAIDELLALEGRSVQDRPLKAAEFFVKEFVPQVNVGSEGPRPPGTPESFILEPWFAAIYSHVEGWYRDRYGGRMAVTGRGAMVGVTLIASTPFEISVPTTVTKPGEHGKTVLLTFPNRILPDEDAVAWLVAPPQFETYSPETRSEARTNATEIASTLRIISSTVIGTTGMDTATRSVVSGIKIHLESAAGLVLRFGQDGGFARAQWELQMACESAFKGVLQQREGAFPETHDLFVLFDRSAPYCPIASREDVRELPRWNETVNLRYGLGDHPTVTGMFHWYRTTLRLVAGVVQGLKGIRFGDGEIEVRRPPWTEV